MGANTGVSVNLVNKSIVFSYKSVTLQVVELSPSFNFNNVKTNLNKSLFFIAASKLTSQASNNANIVQTARKVYNIEEGYTKSSAFSLLNWFFYKFKYHGKGLKVKKSSKMLTAVFNLGSSHISLMYFKPTMTFLFRTKKNTFTAVLLKKNTYLSAKLTKKIRPYNIYTKRGIRVTRQTMYRRFGKVSQIAPKKR